MVTRDVFVGVYVSSRLKKLLLRDSTRRKLSLSVHVNNILATHYGLPKSVDTGHLGKGRKPVARVVLTPEFRNAIIATGKSLESLLLESRLSPHVLNVALAGKEIPNTPKTSTALKKCAEELGYAGEITQ